MGANTQILKDDHKYSNCGTCIGKLDHGTKRYRRIFKSLGEVACFRHTWAAWGLVEEFCCGIFILTPRAAQFVETSLLSQAWSWPYTVSNLDQTSRANKARSRGLGSSSAACLPLCALWRLFSSQELRLCHGLAILYQVSLKSPCAKTVLGNGRNLKKWGHMHISRLMYLWSYLSLCSWTASTGRYKGRWHDGGYRLNCVLLHTHELKSSSVLSTSESGVCREDFKQLMNL